MGSTHVWLIVFYEGTTVAEPFEVFPTRAKAEARSAFLVGHQPDWYMMDGPHGPRWVNTRDHKELIIHRMEMRN